MYSCSELTEEGTYMEQVKHKLICTRVVNSQKKELTLEQVKHKLMCTRVVNSQKKELTWNK